jgi:hypothetical protein
MVAIKIAMMVVRVMVHHVYHATAQGRAGFSPWMRPGTGYNPRLLAVQFVQRAYNQRNTIQMSP